MTLVETDYGTVVLPLYLFTCPEMNTRKGMFPHSEISLDQVILQISCHLVGSDVLKRLPPCLMEILGEQFTRVLC